jgi:hypothetical protein
MNKLTPLPATAQQQTHRLPCVVTSAPSLGEGAVLITAPVGSMPRGDFLTAALAIFSPPSCRESEREAAAKAYIGKVLCGGDADEAKAERDARFEEIEERYLHREIVMKARVVL